MNYSKYKMVFFAIIIGILSCNLTEDPKCKNDLFFSSAMELPTELSLQRSDTISSFYKELNSSNIEGALNLIDKNVLDEVSYNYLQYRADDFLGNSSPSILSDLLLKAFKGDKNRSQCVLNALDIEFNYISFYSSFNSMGKLLY